MFYHFYNIYIGDCGMKARDLYLQLGELLRTFPTAEVTAEGWNDQGDLMQIPLRGDVRLERDAVGLPTIVIR